MKFEALDWRGGVRAGQEAGIDEELAVSYYQQVVQQHRG